MSAMRYQSTRNKSVKLSSAEAIVRGLSTDGGLFVPETFPAITEQAIQELATKSYAERAAYVMGLYLDDFTADELKEYTNAAYSAPGYDDPAIAPITRTDGGAYFLELWHGPTSAFKDMALQMLPRLLTASLKKTGEPREVCILVATSGDTGKAALEGFCDVPGTKIMVFYPQDGVSDIQKLQMTSQRGDNVNVTAVYGNFDDAQTGVKTIFSDEATRAALSKRGYFLSSANSINWGRLLPQIVYYISAYCDMMKSGAIAYGDKLNFCVPTGNFGNILSAYYAKKMGLPIGRLICASNRNDVLTEFISTGVYNRQRPFYTTISPSMDILVSSNLERLLFDLSGGSDGQVAGYMSSLAVSGQYKASPGIMSAIKRDFAAGFCSDEETKITIADMFREHGYLIDTHTAVGYKVLCDYQAETGDTTPTVVVSTASPFKFCDSVLDALGHVSDAGGVQLLDKLEFVSGNAAPAPLSALCGKTARFSATVETSGMNAAVMEFLGGK